MQFVSNRCNDLFKRKKYFGVIDTLTLTSGLRITRARQVYNRDTETGSWNVVVSLRTIKMWKMCQSQQFVTWAWDTGCRLLSHGRSKRRSKASVYPSFCYSGSNFRRKKLIPAVVENVFFFFFFIRTWGWNINKFIFVWIVNEMTFCKVSDYAERTEQKSLNSYHTSAKVQSIS